MMDLYLSRHRGESAIFWCPNVDAAQRDANRFAHLCDVPAAAVHSQEGEIVGLLSSFEVGEIKVIFTVNMLQEGFNMPSLRLAFDCRFHRQLNKYRIARMMQRIRAVDAEDAGKVGVALLRGTRPDALLHFQERGDPRDARIAELEAENRELRAMGVVPRTVPAAGRRMTWPLHRKAGSDMSERRLENIGWCCRRLMPMTGNRPRCSRLGTGRSRVDGAGWGQGRGRGDRPASGAGHLGR